MAFDRIWHKSYAPGVPADVDFEKITPGEALVRTAKKYPRVTAIVFMGKRITYAGLDTLVNRFARGLRSLGIRRGDKIAMLLPNIPQMIIANYAAFKIGAVPVMNNPLYTDRELAFQLADSDSKMLITLDILARRAVTLQAGTKTESIIACHINDYLPFPKKQLFPIVKKSMHAALPPGVHDFARIIREHSPEPLPVDAAWDDLGALIYTGGTTGTGKGVMLTHANLSSNVQQFRAAVKPFFVEGREILLGVFPIFHSAGFTAIQNHSVWMGWTVILVPRPEPGILIELIKKYRPTIIPGVPTIFTGLLNAPKFKSLNLSFVKGFISGAAPLSEKTIRDLHTLTGATMCEVYGITETSPAATATPYGGTIKPGTVGVPFPGTDMKIVDLDSGERELPPGERGEIIFKGPQVMKGYYKKPEETAEAVRNGWFYTGDIGIMDEEGYLTIVDRKKDMIIAGGYNIYPKEIDEALYAHPGVLEACAIGVADAYRGETVKAYVVPKPGASLTEDELREHCKKYLAAYKVPKSIAFIDELPKSAVGKILRRELRELDRKLREQERAS